MRLIVPPDDTQSADEHVISSRWNVASIALCALALFATFAVLSILNSGGYRYGASDQAFYVPAVLRQMDPTLFPRDRALLAVQDHLLILDDLLAEVAILTGISVVHVMFVAYWVMLLAVGVGGWVFGRALLDTQWGAAALVIAMSIRHRVPKTGVNTLEHYFHPRMLAFAAGTAALGALLTRRTWVALALVVLAGIIHPTTGIWFAIVVGVGVVVTDSRHRWVLLGLGVTGVTTAGLLLVIAGPLRHGIVVMDPEWLAVLKAKDYLFPTEWSLATWAQHSVYIIVIALTMRARQRAGAWRPGETALISGLAAMLVLTIASLPLIHARVALAVQLQITRAMWLFDLLAVAYAVWWVVEAPQPQGAAVRGRRWAVALIAVLSLVRGAYVMYVERAGHSVLQVELEPDEWRDATRWIGRQPSHVHVLADPAHARRFGSSVRVAAARDVYLEDVKDAAIAMYSREMAMRVLGRTRALGDFSALTRERALELARTYDLDYLLAEKAIDLPLAYRNARFRVYELR
jgi:hypothetical protein